MNLVKKILRVAGLATIGLMIVVPFLYTSNDEPQAGKTEIQYWHSTGQKDQKPYYVTAFNTTHDSIQVKSVVIPWQEQEKKVLTALLSGNPPDVISQFSPVVKWASRMALRPLDDFIARDGLDSTLFFPALWREMKWQGHIFAIPLYTASYAFFINKRLFREAGLDPEIMPQNWAEVRELSRKLTKTDTEGNYTQIGFIPFYQQTLIPAQMTLPTPIVMAWQLGADFLTDKGRSLNLNNPEMHQACQWILDYMSEFQMDKLAAFTAGFGYGDQHCFVSEKIAMMILPSTFPEHIERYGPGIEYGIGMIPSFQGYATTSFSGCWWVAIPRGAENPEKSWEFIKFMTDKEVQLATVEAMEENLFPANQRAAYDKRFNKDRETNIFIRQIELAHSPAVVPMAHDVFWREFYNAVEHIMQGVQSVDAALEQAEKVVNHELRKNLEYDEYVRSRMDFYD
ncbi:MAG: ABC transporter substrate-binding protein [Candidatus Marinimicrobia bacterium]|nr:ABC transporter substrate-binding protein [Candidatus Neomarinimicrobiota bacterium]